MSCDWHSIEVKGLWDKRPHWYPIDVPFMDPNNRKRTKAEAGAQLKKPTKDELLPMLTYLFDACKVNVLISYCCVLSVS